MRFFRRFFYTNDDLFIEHSYFIRNHSGEYFPFRLWIIKFSGWVIFSLQWFKPVKKRSRRTRRKPPSRLKNPDAMHIACKPYNKGLVRLKVATHFLVKEFISW